MPGWLSRSVCTTVDIDAPPERVWDVLMDWKSYPEWNPFLKSLELVGGGEPAPGGTINAFALSPGQPGEAFKAKLIKVDPPSELCWQGSLPIPGLFAGKHYFVIKELEPGRCRLTQGEDFSGLLVPLMGKVVAAYEQGFGEMNAKLKARAESST